MTSPYERLGILPSATPTEVKAAYHKKLREFPAHTYPEEFKAIRAAYEAINKGETTDKEEFLKIRPLEVEIDAQILQQIHAKAIAQLAVNLDDLIRATFWFFDSDFSTMTNDKEALFAQLLDYLHSEQTPPDYLGQPPLSANTFDLYHVVNEWTALRQELKQQGKLMRSAQESLQQALTATTANQEKAGGQFEQQQEKLLRDLLGILDALDRACTHWEEELAAISTPKNFWESVAQWFTTKDAEVPETSSLKEILISNQQGVELIRRSLLEVLRQRRVVPIQAQGQPFDPQRMYAVGRELRAEIADNTVVQEVVRGYLWGDRVLREAQVIVASPHASTNN